MAAPKKDSAALAKKSSKKEELPPEGSAAYKALVLVGKVKAGSK
jgi:hypothetical protein|tara:strand:+ start:55 stop:186 length:132 start_codon:yes stop_codon:yes gene_type:complete